MSSDQQEPLPSVSSSVPWVAGRIREAREHAGLSQSQLAERLAKTQTAVSYWESGKRSVALDDLLAISDAVGRDVFYFLPPTQPRQSVSAILRAEALRLASHELEQAVDALFDRAETTVPPVREFSVRSRQPAHAANELIELAGVKGPGVDVDVLAARCGVLVLRHPFPDSLSGLILEVDDGAIIGVNSNHRSVRQRFSVGHELGHHLLGHGARFHIDVNDGAPPGQDYMSERAANEFAAELLMPRRFVVKEFDEAPETSRLAERFDVSEIAMGYRLVNLGLR